MSSMIFYLLVTIIVVAAVWLFYAKRRHKNHNAYRGLRPATVNFERADVTSKDSQLAEQTLVREEHSPYDPNFIILQVAAFPGKPYMGYELHQALLAAGLRFGEKHMFHRHAEGERGKILFSLAAATPSGSFAIEDMGSFKCSGLLLFMHLDAKQKLMASFDLMLDTARQLAEELGGEIYDDLQQLLNADVIKRLREKICTVETNNLYTSDLLDNLD